MSKAKASFPRQAVGGGAGHATARPAMLLLGGLLASAAPIGAWAQQAPPASPPSFAVQEIVVTAEKRTATVQSVPISMTALSGAQMQAQGISNLQDVIRDVPGISMRTAGPGQTELEMRGLASSGGSSPTVGFYLDEVPLSPPAAALNGKVVIDPDLYDLNRVEVLRGPQGTLYGSGSMGGTVKLITNEPNLTAFSGSLDATVSGAQGGGANGGGDLMLNMPIIVDKLALRVVGTEKYTSGWIDRVVGGPDFPLETNPTCGAFYGCTRGDVTDASVTKVYKDVNSTQLSGARASLLAQPTSALSVEGSLMYQRTTAGGYSEYDDLNGASGRLAHYQPFDLKEPFSDTFKLASGVIKYDIGSVQITSATSYWHRVREPDHGRDRAGPEPAGHELLQPDHLHRTRRVASVQPGVAGRVEGKRAVPMGGRGLLQQHDLDLARHQPGRRLRPAVGRRRRGQSRRRRLRIRTIPIAWISTPRSARPPTSCRSA